MFNSLKPNKWLGKDKAKAGPTFQNTQEITAFIHKTASKNPDAFTSTSFEWDCCLTEEYLEDVWVKERKDWSDAAYQGDWDGVFKIAAKEPDNMGRLANVTRLLPAGSSIADSHPSGYTVLHQAAYHNAPEEIAKALVTLGCLRQLHSTDGKLQRPVDIAHERGFMSLVAILEPPPDLLPNISPAALEKIQGHFATVVKVEAGPHKCRDHWLQIAAESPAYMGRLANATRLLPAGASIADSHPAGYTVLHQAAHYNAPEEVVKALITLGCLRQLRSTNGKADRPVDIALERGFIPLSKVLEPPPDLLPNISPAALERIQEHFDAVVKYEARRIFKPESMRVADLGILREVKSIWMPVPGMYGGFSLRFEDDHLVTESFCRVMGGSGRTNHVTAEGSVLVDEGWG